MKAAYIEKTNAPLNIKETELPVSTSAMKLVKVTCAGLNHRDLWIQKGKYAGIKLPLIPGSDLTGHIDSQKVIVNPAFYWGDNPSCQSKDFEILGLPSSGSIAEYTLVPKENIYPAPEHLDDIQSAGLPLAGLTAYRALFIKAKVKAGEKVFITGIGGGVALFALQFCLAIGCTVYVSSSSLDKINRAISLGAKGGVNYNNENWENEMLEMSQGIDVVIDGAAGSNFGKFFKMMNYGGRISLYGGTQGNIEKISPQILFWKQLSIFGSTMGSPLDFENMLALVSNHKIVPVIDSIFGLNQINDAFERMNNGLQFGKIIIQITES